MIHDPKIEVDPELQEAMIADPRATILIIDDDEDQTTVLSSCLERLGFGTLTANEGKSGIRRANLERPDLVVLDLNLPDIDGLTVCRDIVDSPDTCGMPVIVVSGKEGDDMVRQCRAAGSEFYLRKPYDPNVLLTLIEQTIGW